MQRAHSDVRILTGKAFSFFSVDDVEGFLRGKTIFDVKTFPFSIDPDKGIDSKTVHFGKILNDAAVTVEPHQLMKAFRCEGEKIPDMRVVFDICAGIRLLGMDEIGKLHGVADKKTGRLKPTTS